MQLERNGTERSGKERTDNINNYFCLWPSMGAR